MLSIFSLAANSGVVATGKSSEPFFFAMDAWGKSDVEVTDVECVVLDELAARLNLVAHQLGEHLLSG